MYSLPSLSSSRLPHPRRSLIFIVNKNRRTQTRRHEAASWPASQMEQRQQTFSHSKPYLRRWWEQQQIMGSANDGSREKVLSSFADMKGNLKFYRLQNGFPLFRTWLITVDCTAPHCTNEHLPEHPSHETLSAKWAEQKEIIAADTKKKFLN